MAARLMKSMYNHLRVDLKAITVWAKGTPMFRKTVESVKSRCKREMGSLLLKWSRKALAMPKLPSEFSKSIGFTLWGMAEEPTSPALIFCLK